MSTASAALHAPAVANAADALAFVTDHPDLLWFLCPVIGIPNLWVIDVDGTFHHWKGVSQ